MARPTNTRFALAVHVLTLLAAHRGDVLSSEFLASSAGANPVHVRRVLGPLREGGLLRSRPGVRGGWELAADPATTTLADVWDAVQGDDPLLGLHRASPECVEGQAIAGALGGIERRAAGAVRAELARTTLRGLVDEALAAGPVARAS